MPGPGQYVPDATEGITRVEDLPKPQIVRRSRIYERRPCPRCGKSCRRRTYQRTLHELGDFVSGRPRDIHLTYSQHHCRKCRKFFNADMSDLAAPKAHYTHRVISLAVRLVVEDGLPYRTASWHLWRDHRVFVPFATLQNWVEAGGEKALAAIEQSYLDWALEGFSGYIAADDLYDGPFCVLSLVDNRTFKRIAYRVLDHDPTQDDIRQFFQDFQARLELRGLVVRGITTDGSALYPEPIQQVFGDVPHQICAFHVIAELTKAVLGAVAKVRKTLAGRKPKLSRDRPSKRARKAARQSKRIGQKVAELFEHRYLFMKHHLSPAEQKTIRRITRGLPVTHLAPDHGRGLPAVRSSLPHRHRLGQTGTAAPPRGPLQTGGQDPLELFSPNLEQALTSLDDKCLPAMSNAVERGNRRYRKMQKTVYSVRTQPSIRARIALDMLRDASAKRRADTTLVLHEARTG